VVTHGSIPVMVRWLRQIGLDAKAFDTEYGDEDDEATGVASSNAAGSAAPEEGEAHKDGAQKAEAKDA
jgi:putative mRNA 3-end processing factor